MDCSLTAVLPTRNGTPMPLTRRAAPSPLSLLPIDLLLAIFESASLSWDASASILITLSRVCSRWRDCIMKTPTLWATIRVVEIMDTTLSSIERETKRVKAFLKMSRACALVLDFAIYTYFRHEGEENGYADNLPAFLAEVGEISKVIGQHASRIRSLTLLVDEYSTNGSILSGLVGVPMPILERWDVRNTYDEVFGNEDDDIEDEEEDAHSVLLHPLATVPSKQPSSLYPSLQVLSLNSVPLHWSRYAPSALVTLEITMLPDVWRLSASAIGHILQRNAHSLETLTLLGALSSNSSKLQTVVLPNLAFMELGFYHTSELTPFLNGIDVPKLKTFILYDSRRQELHPSDRSEDSMFDAGIVDLFSVIARRLPVAKIWDLTLRHIAFCPPNTFPSLDVSRYIARGGEAALEFFYSLESLKFLLLCGPDQATLDGLNRAKTFRVSRPRLPTPRMTILHIADTGFHMLKSFLWSRLAYPDAHNKLVALVISMPFSWYHMTQWQTVDTSSLAKEVVSFATKVSSEVEKELMIT
ncbi:hypothetical protein DXG01_003217 [Tephrocybe rancida]|nr:hypothetical protein DXG01_003217 [Tephrocybe rancida]